MFNAIGMLLKNGAARTSTASGCDFASCRHGGVGVFAMCEHAVAEMLDGGNKQLMKRLTGEYDLHV